jgi:hypothetical protein
MLRRALSLFLLAVSAVSVWAAGPAVTVVGTDLGDLAPIFSALQLEPRLVASVAEIPRDARSVLVLASDYPRPRVLSASECDALEGLVGLGARVFVEYATLAPGTTCCGLCPVSAPQRAIHQRLVVLRQMGGLAPEDLLEEHDGAFIAPGAPPPHAETLLEYDLAYGTYRRIPAPDRSAYTVTVDLGDVYELTGVSQRYGAGQPNYTPESVELWLSEESRQFSLVERLERDAMPETVRFGLERVRARYVRLVARKSRRSPVTDFLFMGEIEVMDGSGRNVAPGRPYELTSQGEQAAAYRDNGRKLTDGLVEGHYSDGLSVGFGTGAATEGQTLPAILRVPWERGLCVFSAPAISSYTTRNFRLQSRWEELWRQLVLDLMPAESRAAVASAYVPLEAHTEPRVWAEPGAEVKLSVRTVPGAQVAAVSAQQGELALGPEADGSLVARFVAAPGTDRIEVRAATETGQATQVVLFDCRSREDKYRQAVDRNMGWFSASGVLPAADGSQGIHSQVCMAWLDGGFQNPLGSPFRVDCNAMSAQAFYLYGRLTGEQRYLRLARNIADTVLSHQYTDETRPSLGGFPWLYENSDIIYFWDDNCRIGTALLWLYHWTGEERYLRGALLNAELFRQVAREDGCVHRHAISRGALDALGREAYRQYSDGADPDFRIMHWWTLAAVTGDETYAHLARLTTDTWVQQVGLRGASHAAFYAGAAPVRERLGKLAESFLADPAVAQHGMLTVHGGEYERAFVGDCGIATEDGEPLTDQIYGTPWYFRAAVRGWKASGDEACRRMAQTVGDYLVRIQFSSPDPRLDGCWMRGFDVQAWDYYGAPYDPQYGPYAAYTGWMNAIASEAFCWYLLDEPPFVPLQTDPRAAAMVEEVRKLSPSLVSDGPNVALGCRYTLSAAAAEAYADDGIKLTDGVADGHYQDHASVGWHLQEVGQEREVRVTVDLGQSRRLKLMTQSYGAGVGDYNPDRVALWASADGREFVPVAHRIIEGRGGGYLWVMPADPVEARFLRFDLLKRRRGPSTDFLFAGEIRAYEEP